VNLGVRTALLAAALAAAQTSVRAADGAALFKTICAVCHQEDASGTVGLAPPLLGAHWQRLGAERNYLPTVVLRGLSGPIKAGAVAFNGNMPSFAGQLNDEEGAAVATHLRGLQGAAGEAPYRAEEFAALRKNVGNPAQTRALRKQILGE
jgi:mono/diheme cytochrome c family protein